MLLRALIVLLVVLNLGVALWWATGSTPTPTTVALPAAHAPRLQLVGDVHAVPPSAVQSATPAATTPAVAALACYSIGPFAQAAALEAARAAIAPRVAQLRVRAAGDGRHGWKVWLPPLSDHDSAVAMAARIDAAGFKDYYVLPSGADDGNGIALGRFGNEQAARRQQAALQAAGFPAQAGPVGGGNQWLDVAGPALEPATLRDAIGSARIEPRDCRARAPQPG